MKIKLVITAMLAILFSSLKAQDVILGEKKPCPGETYEYFFNGASCDGNLSWSLIDGVVMQQTSNSVKVRWNEGIVGNGRWKIRVIYNPRKSDGSCGTSTFYDLPIDVNAVSEFNIVGDREIPGGFRGVKTYTAQIKNSSFPASSYMWTVFSEGTATNYTTTLPSFNLNITNDGPKWISVRGKNSTCSSWGLSIKADLFTTTEFSGPSSICDEGIYTILNPGTVTLENAAGIATLTALGNNQWKVTRLNNTFANGNVIVRSTKNSILTDFPIKIGSNTSAGNFFKLPMTGVGTYLIRFTDPHGDFDPNSINWHVSSSTNNVELLNTTGKSINVKVNSWNTNGSNNITLQFNATTVCGQTVSREMAIGPGSEILNPDS